MATNLTELLRLPKLNEYFKTVDSYLVKSVDTENKLINKQAQRLINAGGKRLRPALLIAVASANGKSLHENVFKLAAAVEFVHLGSLVHDDIIDEANKRWNIPTINYLKGQNQAIVIGDYLLAKACELAAEVGQIEAKLIASTITKLCDGQSRELAELYNLQRSQKSYFECIDGKTAALINLATQLGGMQAGLNDNQLQALKVYSYNFGRSFQLIDDLMDLVSTEKIYGKPIGNDLVEGVYTLPVIFGLRTKESAKIKKILKTKKFDPEIVDLLLRSKSIHKTLSIVRNNNRQAASALKNNGPTSRTLQKMPDDYLNWVLDNYVAKTYQPILKMQ